MMENRKDLPSLLESTRGIRINETISNHRFPAFTSLHATFLFLYLATLVVRTRNTNAIEPSKTTLLYKRNHKSGGKTMTIGLRGGRSGLYLARHKPETDTPIGSELHFFPITEYNINTGVYSRQNPSRTFTLSNRFQQS